jgi:hypothetical protein
VNAWNQWRKENPKIEPDLSGQSLAYVHSESLMSNQRRLRKKRGRTGLTDEQYRDLLTSSYLNRINLSGALLRETTFERVSAHYADFRDAYLRDADFREADLRNARFEGADLIGADLRGAVLSGTDFASVQVSGTIFSEIDLSSAKGLETVRHYGPSTIGIDTIYKSKGNIPEVFLRGAGVPENFITYMKSLAGSEKAFEFYSCFISYSTKDQAFADRLYADLQAKGVRCWKFDENAKWGEPLWGEIDTAIRHYDKLVVICSDHSLQSPPVVREIERALQKEDRERKNVLFPVRIDDYLFEKWDHPRKADVVSKVVGNFCGCDDLPSYAKAFNRLLDALNRPQRANSDT